MRHANGRGRLVLVSCATLYKLALDYVLSGGGTDGRGHWGHVPPKIF